MMIVCSILKDIKYKGDLMMNKSVSYKISWMTFLANILILLQHSHLVNFVSTDRIDGSKFAMDFFSNISLAMMSWFFFITAYLFFRKVNSIEVIWNKMRNRIFTLGIPYLLWNTFGMILHIIGGEYSSDVSVLRIIRYTYIFYNGEGCGNVPLWYIFRIFTFTLFAPILFHVLGNMKRAVFILCEIIVIVLNICFDIGYYDLTFFLPIYLIGAYLGRNYYEIFEKYFKGVNNCKKSKIKVIVLSLILIVMSYIKFQINFKGVDLIYRCISLGIIIMLLHEIDIKIKPTKFILSAGMYLYCCHDLVYRFVRNIILPHLHVTMAISWLVMISISFGIMVGSWYVLDRFLPSVLKMLSGGRSVRKLQQ